MAGSIAVTSPPTPRFCQSSRSFSLLGGDIGLLHDDHRGRGDGMALRARLARTSMRSPVAGPVFEWRGVLEILFPRGDPKDASRVLKSDLNFVASVGSQGNAVVSDGLNGSDGPLGGGSERHRLASACGSASLQTRMWGQRHERARTMSAIGRQAMETSKEEARLHANNLASREGLIRCLYKVLP